MSKGPSFVSANTKVDNDFEGKKNDRYAVDNEVHVNNHDDDAIIISQVSVEDLEDTTTSFVSNVETMKVNSVVVTETYMTLPPVPSACNVPDHNSSAIADFEQSNKQIITIEPGNNRKEEGIKEGIDEKLWLEERKRIGKNKEEDDNDKKEGGREETNKTNSNEELILEHSQATLQDENQPSIDAIDTSTTVSAKVRFKDPKSKHFNLGSPPFSVRDAPINDENLCLKKGKSWLVLAPVPKKKQSNNTTKKENVLTKFGGGIGNNDHYKITTRRSNRFDSNDAEANGMIKRKKDKQGSIPKDLKSQLGEYWA